MIALTHHVTGSNLAIELASEPEEMAYLIKEYCESVSDRDLKEVGDYLKDQTDDTDKNSIKKCLEILIKALSDD